MAPAQPSLPDLEKRLVSMVGQNTVPVPPYPGIAMRLRALVATGTYGLSDVARLVSEDQVLTVAALRAANSAQQRGIAPITTLPEAVSRLGVLELGRIALAASLGKMAAQDGPLASLRRLAWRRGLISALVCRQLASGRILDAEEAFVCGLLHDFGRLVTVACLESMLAEGAPWAPVPEAAWMALVDRVQVDVGLITAVRWNLPEIHRVVISSAHRPEAAGDSRDMVELVVVSDEVVSVVEKHAYVLARDLADISKLRRPKEVDALMMLLPLLPGFLSGLDDALPLVPAKSDSGVSEVALPGTHRAVTMTAVQLRAGEELPLRVVSLVPTGLVVTTRERMREHNLIRLRLDTADGRLSLSATVLLSAPAAREYRNELALFALTEPQKIAWDKVYAAAANP